MDNLSSSAFGVATSALAENEEGWRALEGIANRHGLNGESRWSSADNGYPAILTIYLPWQAVIRGIRLVHCAQKPPYPYWYARSYRLEAWKDKGWICLARESNLQASLEEEKTGWFVREYMLHDPLKIKLLRYVVESGWEPHASIKELKILGNLPPGATSPLGCIVYRNKVSFLLQKNRGRHVLQCRGETTIDGTLVHWLWKCQGQGNNRKEILKVKSERRLVADVFFWRWSEIESQKYFPLQITNAGVVVQGKGKFLSILNDFGQDPFTFGVSECCRRIQVGKRHVNLKFGVEVSLLVRKGRSENINSAKVNFFRHITDVYGHQDFRIPKIPYSFFEATKRAVEHLKSPTSYLERDSGVIWFKQRYGRGVELAKQPDHERYEVGFVGFGVIAAKALWDWSKLTDDAAAKQLSQRAIQGLFDFQIRKSDHPNYGAFWDGITDMGQYEDFNCERYVWIWTNARIAYYLLQMSREIRESQLQKSALLALEWILRKRNTNGYWSGDKVDESGRITGQKNTVHGVEVIRPLVLASILTEKKSYLEAARKIAVHAIKNFVHPFRTGDVLEDVQQESVDQGWVIAMIIENLLYLYRVTGDRTLLVASRRCGEWLLPWQFPRTPEWAKTPNRLDLTGTIICEDARGSYNFPATHETMEPAAAWMDLYAVDPRESWLHASIAALSAVVRFQHANGAYTDGAIPESVNIRSGNWNNWCWTGWCTAEIVHVWTRLLFGLANSCSGISIDWETLGGKVQGKPMEVNPILTKELASSLPPFTECLVLSTYDSSEILFIILAHMQNQRVEILFPVGYNYAIDCISGHKTRRLFLRPYGDFAHIGCFFLKASPITITGARHF